MVTAMSENMRIYNAARNTPDNAKKKITGGAYGAAGLTDINTQWRIEKMTEIFGPVGSGWIWEPVKFWTEFNVCYAQVSIQYLLPNGEWSLPIYGYGGTKIGGKDDSDIYKSTITDAVGNAMKYLGIGADVVYKVDNKPEENQFDSKYSAPPLVAPPSTSKPAEPPAQPQPSQQHAAPAKPQQLPQMAAPGQKQFIIENASYEQYQALKQTYGAELENLTYKTAAKAIEKIQRGMNGNGN